MMYESVQGDSLWKPYLDILPMNFDSLMHWTEDEKLMLQGSTVLGKIGKEQAVQDYTEIILPLVERRSDIFGDPANYAIDLYDRMGSAVLSRSFHVEAYETETDDGAGEATAQDASMTSATSVPADGESGAAGPEGNDDIGSLDDDEDEDASVVAMVPWADMLNARPDLNNARLFYEKDSLSMSTTKLIRQGEQIVGASTRGLRELTDANSGTPTASCRTPICFANTVM